MRKWNLFLLRLEGRRYDFWNFDCKKLRIISIFWGTIHQALCISHHLDLQVISTSGCLLPVVVPCCGLVKTTTTWWIRSTHLGARSRVLVTSFFTRVHRITFHWFVPSMGCSSIKPLVEWWVAFSDSNESLKDSWDRFEQGSTESVRCILVRSLRNQTYSSVKDFLLWFVALFKFRKG